MTGHRSEIELMKKIILILDAVAYFEHFIDQKSRKTFSALLPQPHHIILPPPLPPRRQYSFGTPTSLTQ